LIVAAAFATLVASNANAVAVCCVGPDSPGGSPSTPLLSAFDPETGSYRYYFEVGVDQRVYVDPDVATGYIYQVDSTSPLITSAQFTTALIDSDGYQIYALEASGERGNFLGNVAVGGMFTFASAVGGFWLEGIDPANMLDPLNPQAFVAGFTFDRAGTVSLTQTPITASSIPEPETWAMLLAGLGIVGTVAKRRRLG
jgi:hypothetical protein